ncbi:MAG: hypothetical protein C4519_14780 [Desulfobacteraceae bacterium]|nr:MAG: hypothetical protein C4519_14780 [Desulfobacteraceae bacterium]
MSSIMPRDNFNFKLFLKKMGPARFAQKVLFPDQIHKVNDRPIFLTGIYRSGTSWVGKIISFADSLICYREPFNPSVVQRMPQQYYYISPEKDNLFYADFTEKLLKGHLVGADFDYTTNNNYFNFRHSRYLIKDPTAAFLTEWLSNKYSFETIILLRHPAGFVSSILKLNWDFDLSIFLNQKNLMDEHLHHFKFIINKYNYKGMTIEKGAVIWGVIYYFLNKLINNEGYYYIKYEDICKNPYDKFKEIFDKFSLMWNERVEHEIKLSTESASTFSRNTFCVSRDTSKMDKIWMNRLTVNQIKTIKRITSEFDIPYYRD